MRDKFSATGYIPVTDLHLDQNNYRLGPLENQSDCIAMMLELFPAQMENIAKDIATRGLSPRPIVVLKDVDGKWVVKDGNRRVTALKLLNNPSEAPENKRHAFQRIKDGATYGRGIPDKIECLTADKDTIRDYMALDHGGLQEGVGQMDWGSREKDNMRLDLGGRLQSPFAMAVCAYMQKHGLKEASVVPITNLQRLIQDKYVSDALGIDWNGTSLVFRADEKSVRDLLKEVILDFSVRKKTVQDIFHKPDRQNYIDQFFGERGFKRPAASSPATPSVPAASPVPPNASSGGAASAGAGASNSIPAIRTSPRDRKRLIAAKNGLSIPAEEVKLRSIVVELTSALDVREAPIAAGMLLRAVIEFSVNRYAKASGINFPEKEHLHNRIIKAAEHMAQAGLMDKKYLAEVKKVSDSEQIISTHTLNAIAHSSYIPKASDLCTFYDNFRLFLLLCWR